MEKISKNTSILPHSKEELANALTHGFGLLMSIIGMIILLAEAYTVPDSWLWSSVLVYSLSLTVLYAASTIYHSLRHRKLKRLFNIIDHAAIFLLIAGTYTPFCLVLLRNTWASSLIWIVWGIALSGVVFKIFYTGKFQRASTLIYLALGWLCIIALKPIIATIPHDCLMWIVAGGLSYTGGTIFFHWESLPYNHAIWHLFVLVGSACHFISIFNYILPLQ